MRLIPIILLTCIGVSAGAQTTVQIKWTKESDMSPSTTVYYQPGKPLEWADFQGVPEQTGNTAALTTSGFGYRMSMGYTGTRGTIKIFVYCYFDKMKSWVKPDKMNDYVLNHEQMHFDISYLAANRFMQSLKKINFTRENLSSQLQEAYDASSHWMEEQQHAYDRQTRNGISKSDQESWSKLITRQLRAIKD